MGMPNMRESGMNQFGLMRYGDLSANLPEHRARFVRLLASIEIRNGPFNLKLIPHPGEPFTAIAQLEVLERDTGKPINLQIDQDFSQVILSDDATVLNELRTFIHWAVKHELDECLYVDGKRKWDPHGPTFIDVLARMK